MPRSEEAFRQIRDDRREQILEVAGQVFAKNGYVGTRIDDIARAARISKGLVYHYFSSKEAIFNALVEGAVTGTLRLFREVLASDGSAARRLTALIEQEIQGMAGDPHRFLVILQALVSDAAPAAAREMVLRLVGEVDAATVRLISEGQREGDIVSGDPRELAFLLESCIQGLAAATAAPGLTPTLPAAESLVALLVSSERRP